MASLIQELFHLVAGKNSLLQKENFKPSFIRTAIAERFQRQGNFFLIREDSQGPLETGGKIFVHPSHEVLG